MGLCLSTTTCLQSTKRSVRSSINKSLEKQQSPHNAAIHILDDDSLLNIFYLYRPFFLGEDETDWYQILAGRGRWVEGCWWYRLTHVCQRWRNLILSSASYLRLSLVCTNGTPVEDMLAHSPPLPLTIDYGSEDGITSEDEKVIMRALEQRHRVRHLRLCVPVQILRKLLTVIDEAFPILEYLILDPLTEEGALILPETLQAPHLRHLTLRGFAACSIRPQVAATASLVTLFLIIDLQSAYFQPNVLLQWISLMPQLEILDIHFTFPVPDNLVERQLAHTPTTARITLPNLRLFWFRGVSAYLDAVVCRIATPRLENLQVRFFNELAFSLPCLPQFIKTTNNLRFDDAVIMFQDIFVDVRMFFREATALQVAFGFRVDCWHLDRQVSSVAQISNNLSQIYSAVGRLTLKHELQIQSSEEHNDVADRIEWRNLLRSFSKVKVLRVEDRLVHKLSRCLRLEDGEPPLELLPELQELTYFGSRDIGDEFTSFIHARHSAGHPVTLVHRGSGARPSNPSSKDPTIT